MKLALFIVTAMLAFSKFAEAQVIFEEDFSGPSFANWIRGTKGDLVGTFINTFSVGSTLQDNSGNPYREYDITITQGPPDDGVTWYGGANFHVGGITVLPSEWELSFEVFMDTVEPIRIQFLVVENLFPFPPKSSLALTAWALPSQIGWNSITLDRGAFVAEYTFGGPPIEGTSLIISMTSHDASLKSPVDSQRRRLLILPGQHLADDGARTEHGWHAGSGFGRRERRAVETEISEVGMWLGSVHTSRQPMALQVKGSVRAYVHVHKCRDRLLRLVELLLEPEKDCILAGPSYRLRQLM